MSSFAPQKGRGFIMPHSPKEPHMLSAQQIAFSQIAGVAGVNAPASAILLPLSDARMQVSIVGRVDKRVSVDRVKIDHPSLWRGITQLNPAGHESNRPLHA
jgi:hypothetical protein